ncbi:MAG: exosortase system-associated protein, TIGR04073 family [Candidatus Omnitrophica bacterium]|nr:exosortase system-associated protein, TIGR04073 family [Candidatus Omnitrophota bacterium]
MWVRVFFLGALFILQGSQGMEAATSESSAHPPEDRVEEMMGRYNLHPAFEKLGRGVSNVLGSPLEIPLNIHKRYSTRDRVSSMLTGTAYGFFKGFVRFGVGFYETVTFFLPYPEDFAPILPTLEYFRHPLTREPLPLD